MNRLFFALIFALLICNFCVMADYDNPPMWQGQTAYTHQSWDFGDSGEYGTSGMVTDMSALPLGSDPDGTPELVNEYGTPSLDTFYNSHMYMKGWMYDSLDVASSRLGLYGGNGDTALTFTVPGTACGTDLVKQIWLQTIVYARKDGEQQVASVQIARDAMFSDTNDIVLVSELVEPLNETEGYSAAWYRVTWIYEVPQSGDAEYIKVTAYKDPELPDPQRLGASMIDRVDIDTRFVLKSGSMWEGQEGYTHQSWDFGDEGEYGTDGMISDMSQLPLGSTPDGDPELVNEYGMPSLDTYHNTHPYMKGWMYPSLELSSPRVALYGGMGDTTLTFTVPGINSGDDMVKQIWVQTIVYARKDGGQIASVQIARDGLFTDTDGVVMVSELVEPLAETEGYSAAWYKVTWVYEVPLSAANDYLKVVAYYDPQLPDPQRLGASMIDRVDIDTRFVLKADINRNGVVDNADFAAFASQWLTDDAFADFDASGQVWTEDLVYLAQMWLGSN